MDSLSKRTLLVVTWLPVAYDVQLLLSRKMKKTFLSFSGNIFLLKIYGAPGILTDMSNNTETERNRSLTVTEIANMAGVSIATVSRVLNGNPHVKQGNVDKVTRVLNEYGHVAPVDRHKYASVITIGLIVPDIANPWFPSLIKGVENVSRLHDFNLVLSDSENDPDVEADNIETMVSRGVSGLILVPTDRNSSASMRLVDEGFPVVFLDREIESRAVNFVTSMNAEGAYQATKYLISLGHRQIAYVSGSEQIDTEWKRRSGYNRALEEAGIEADNSLIVPGNYDLEQARRGVLELLTGGVSFTAVFASDDVMAYGAKSAITGHGLAVPQDISIIGFDDIAYSSLMGLTTVAQSPFELGKNAVLLMGDILAGRVTGPKTIELPTSIAIRDSCAPPRRH